MAKQEQGPNIHVSKDAHKMINIQRHLLGVRSAAQVVDILLADKIKEAKESHPRLMGIEK